MGDILGHDEGITLMQKEYFIAHGKPSGAIQNGYHGIAAGGMGGNLFAPVKGEQRHADGIVLHQRFADNLTVLIFHQIFQFQANLFFDILKHGNFS